MALYGTWGVITFLAREFKISRTLVYMMMNDPVKKRAIVSILCLRLEGRCSVISISKILRRFGISKYSSVGSVSEILQFAGECLPNALVNEESGAKLLIMASDEIFSHLRPILITVDPVSSAAIWSMMKAHPCRRLRRRCWRMSSGNRTPFTTGSTGESDIRSD